MQHCSMQSKGSTLQQQHLRCRSIPSTPSHPSSRCAARTGSRSSSRCQAEPNGKGSWRSNLFSRSGGSSSSGSRTDSPLSSVLSSFDEAEQQAQQAAAFRQAFQDGTLGFGFSAGGLLFPVSSLLQLCSCRLALWLAVQGCCSTLPRSSRAQLLSHLLEAGSGT
jgi:hypothetical protein